MKMKRICPSNQDCVIIKLSHLNKDFNNSENLDFIGGKIFSILKINPRDSRQEFDYY